MKNSKKLAVFAIAAMAAFSAGAATVGVSGPAIAPINQGTSVLMGITNNTGGCVRVYAGGQRDLQAGASTRVTVGANQNYMASVFKGRCGGAAVKNVWFRTPGSGLVTWQIR